MPIQIKGRFLSSICAFLLVFIMVRNGLGQTYYWIGNNGNWSNPNHWSYESGGESCLRVPSGADNVVFDSNSFSTTSRVLLDKKNIVVGSLKIDQPLHKIILDGNKSSLTINGSLFINAKDLKIQNLSAIHFSGNNSINEIDLKGYILETNIFFDGNYKLKSDFVIGGLKDIQFISGKIWASKIVVKAHNFYNNSTQNFQFNLSKTYFVATGTWFGSENNLAGNYQIIGKNGHRETSKVLATCSIVVVSDYNGRDISCANADDAILKLEIDPDPPDSGVYSFAWNGPGGQTWETQTISNIGPGSYSVVVKNNGIFQCYQEKLSLEEPTEIRLVEDVPIANPTCSYDCNGQSNLEDGFPKEIQGGTFPYILTWNKDKGNEEVGSPATNLCVGLNSLQITDVNSCPGVDTIIVIQEPIPISFNAKVENVSCSGGNNGSIELNPSGENGGGISSNYTATYNSGSGPISMPGLSVSGLSVGTYVISVKDQNNCSRDTTIEITQPDLLGVNIVEKVNLNCNSDCIGKIVLSPINGTRPYSFVWYNRADGLPIGINDSVADGLCAGVYYAEVKDFNNCLFTTPDIEITEPSVILTNLSTKDVLCFEDCNGTATISASGGTPFPSDPKYQYQWFNTSTNNPIGQSTSTAINLCKGEYYCEVRDSENCKVTSANIEIFEPLELKVSIAEKNPTCFGDCNGEVESVVTGGVLDYNYQWKNITEDTIFSVDTSKISGLCKGRYSVLVRDKNLCVIQSDTVSLIEPEPLDPIVTITDVTCAAPNNGTAKVVVTKGTPPYEYIWSSSGNKTDTENNLAPGNYSVTIVDDNNCDTIVNFTINAPDPIVVNLTSNSSSCENICNGSILGNASGGSGDYSFQWLDEFNNPIIGENTNTLSDLCKGTYKLKVVDNQTFCETIKEEVLVAPNGVKLSLDAKTETTCKNICDGTALISTSGGKPPYVSHEWFNQLTDVPTGHTGENPTNLCAGEYYVVVQDDAGCKDTLRNIEVLKLSEITGVLTAPDTIDCFGDCSATASIVGNGGSAPYTYQWLDTIGNTIGTLDNISNLCIGEFTVVVTDSKKCTSDSIEFEVFSRPDFVITKDSSNISCNGLCDGEAKVNVGGATPNYSYKWSSGTNNETSSVAKNLCDGSYNVKITDGKFCDTTVTFKIVEPNKLEIGIIKEDIPCFGSGKGKIKALPTGGTPNYSYKWFDANGDLIVGAKDSIITDLLPGKYTVMVTDLRGCIAKKEVQIVEQTQLVLKKTQKDNLCFGDCKGAISISASGGLFPYEFEWRDSNNNPIPGQNDSLIENLCSDKYYVYVKDASGCEGLDSIAILQPEDLTIVVDKSEKACFESCEGKIKISITGGIKPYEIVWKDKNDLEIGTSDSISKLCSGEYFATIVDSNSCKKSIGPILIEEYDNIEATFKVDSAVCNKNDGKITVIPVGSDVFEYQWFDNLMNPLGTDSIQANLNSGVYHVELTSKSTNCSKLFTVALSNTGGPKIAIDSLRNPSCFGSCDGDVFVSVTGDNSPFKYLWSPGGSTSEDLQNVCAGEYILEVEDVIGCKLFEQIDLNEPDSLKINISSSDASCGLCNGSINVGVSGGVGPYQFQWLDSLKQPITGQNDTLIENLCKGKYFIEVKDNKGCIRLDSIFLFQTEELSVNVSNKKNTCFDFCEGEIQISISGGKEPYDIIWKDKNNLVVGTVDSITKLCAGEYTATIEDANSCSKSIGPIIIEEYDNIEATFKVDSAVCSKNDGKITVISVGQDLFDYQWFDHLMNPLGTDSILENILSGIYHVKLTSKTTTCSKLFTTTLSNSGSPKLIIDSLLEPSCFGMCDGKILISVNGNNSPFKYLWNPGGRITEDLIDVCADDYLLEIEDSKGCKLFEEIKLNEPDSIQLKVSKKDATCGVCDGSIEITNADTSLYSYVWSNGQTTSSVMNLCSGNYSLLVTNKISSCSKKLDFVINTSEGPIIDVNFKKNPTCNNLCNGEIEISLKGGIEPYDINWAHDGSKSKRVENLCEGNYFVQVRDKEGCESSLSIDLIEPRPILDSVYIVPASCGKNNGQIHLNLIGGVQPFTVFWKHNGSSSLILTDLSSGFYTAHVKDFNGCNTSFTYNVPDKDVPIPDFIVEDFGCGSSCSGKLFLKGNLTAKEYDLLDENGQFISNIKDSVINICPGEYWVLLDSAGCKNSKGFSISEKDSLKVLSLTKKDVSCFGFCDGFSEVFVEGGNLPYKFIWNDSMAQKEAKAEELCKGTWTVQIIDKNGCVAKDSANIKEPEQINLLLDKFKHPKCFGIDDGIINISVDGGIANFEFNWTSNTGFVSKEEDIFQLAEGAYYLQILDSNNCLYLDSFVLSSEIHINADAGPDLRKCQYDTINLVGSNGKKHEWFNNNGKLIGTDKNISLLVDTGNHFFVLKISDQECFNLDTVNVNVFGLPMADAGEDKSALRETFVEIGGSPTTIGSNKIVWSPNINLSVVNEMNPTAYVDFPITYYLRVTDNNGCSNMDSVVVKPIPDIVIPSGISPNGDGKNDTWSISGIQEYPDAAIEIYNRWGHLLYSANNGYKNDWDGAVEGKLLPSGTYFYIVKLNHPLFPDPFSGPVTIFR